jgi:hypothetical protein
MEDRGSKAIVVGEEEAACMLSASRAALRRWRREGRGPQFTRLERCVRYEIRAIENFIAENSSGSKMPGHTQSTSNGGAS